MDLDDEMNRSYEAYLEKDVVVMLRDGRFLYGVMKSFDQFNSVALDAVIERMFHDKKYAEKQHGLVVIRGENISMIGLKPSTIRKDLIIEEFNALSSEISKLSTHSQVDD